MAFCANCGTDIGTHAFCSACGARQSTPPAGSGDKTAPRPADVETTRVRPIAGQTLPPPAGQPAPQPVRQPAAPMFATPPPTQPPAVPPPLSPHGSARRRWSAGWISVSMVFLTGLAACGFVIAYFFVPAAHKDNTIKPAAPQLAASTSEDETDAPAKGTSERAAWDELQRIAAQDHAALQSTQMWRAQLASSPVTESAKDFLARYRATMQKMPNSLLAWSGDWPASYAAPGSLHSWVILSNFTKPTTAPIINWCVEKDLGCWAKRLTTIGVPADNTDHPPADPGKN